MAHAAGLAPLLDDTDALHEFTGGAPLSAVALAARYARLPARRSPGGDQMWGNWVVRVSATGTVAGTAQATLPPGRSRRRSGRGRLGGGRSTSASATLLVPLADRAGGSIATLEYSAIIAGRGTLAAP